MLSFFFTLRRMMKALVKAFTDKEFQVLLALTIIILISGTIFYSTVENFSVLDALYFSVTTLTTIGAGDLAPQTEFGKIFTIIFVISGVGIILAFINKISHHIQTK